ncbi:MAG: carbohydrate kinase family protein [Pirellulales bacterium]|nr:carbohydrate kinase family protein [Pirellulales bacterium]
MPNNEQTAQPKIAVIGATSVDITIREAPDWMGHTGRDIYTRESMHALEAPIEMGLGGNGGAAAYVLGKLGLPVELLTSIGTDAPGQLVRGWLQQAGVRSIETMPADSTMVALSAVDGQGKRQGCLQHPGAKLDWLVSASDTEAAWLLVMVHSLVTPDELQTVHQTMRKFRQADRLIALDSGMGWILNRAEPKRIHALWGHAHVVIGTLDELSHWTGKKDPESVAQDILGHGAAHVVIKMGADGASYQSAVYAFSHQPAISIARSDRSIGAGDAFAGALVGSLATGQPLPIAVTNAQHVAAQVVESGRGVLAISPVNS